MTSERPFRIVFVLLAALAGCADFSRGPAPAAVDSGAGEGGAVSPDAAVSFAADVHGILIGSCQRCHAEGAEAGDTLYLLTGDTAADLAATLRFIDLNAPASSQLLGKVAGRGHGGGTLFAAGTPEYQTMLTWIQEGARP
jgi:hypothetical protein